MSAPTTCIVIPNHNHGEGFAQFIERLLPEDLPIIVVNDGSDAATGDILTQVAAQHEQVSLLNLPNNLGKGGAVITGLREAARRGFSHVLQIDADGQHDSNDLVRFLAASATHPSAVINGTPIFDDSVPKLRLYARYLTHACVWLETLSLSIKDSMCGFRVYPLASVMQILEHHRIGQRMDFDTEILVRLYWQGVEIREQPTKVIYPPGGRSNFRAWEDNWRITCMHTRLILGMLPRIPSLLKRRRSQRQTQHWAGISERGSLLGMRVLLWIYRHLGRLPLLIILHPVMLYFSVFGGAARRASRQYLTTLYRHQGRQDNPRWIDIYRHFYAFGVASLDKVASWTGKIRRDDLVFHHEHNFDKISASGKGAVFLGSHLGNLEVCRALGEKNRRFRINAIVFHRHAQKFQALLRQAAPDVELNLIQVDQIDMDTTIRLKQKVDEGEIIIIVGDRTPVNSVDRVLYADILGIPAPFSIGPFILASVMDCPTYLLFCLKEQGSYHVHLEAFADSLKFPRAQREQRLQEKIQDYADRLGYHCARVPEQWFNFYDFWHEDLAKGAPQANQVSKGAGE